MKNYPNIKRFLSEKKFEKCETLQLNWLMLTGNEQIYYENKPVKIRFANDKKNVSITGIKSIWIICITTTEISYNYIIVIN